jgi:hypothetical protein
MMLANRIDFSRAVQEMRTGDCVSRDGWNGANQWIRYIDLYNDKHFAVVHHEDAIGDFSPFLVLKTAQNKLVPWTPSQTDQLAEDWFVVKGVK